MLIGLMMNSSRVAAEGLRKTARMNMDPLEEGEKEGRSMDKDPAPRNMPLSKKTPLNQFNRT
jgi:hypothetical protein